MHDAHEYDHTGLGFSEDQSRQLNELARIPTGLTLFSGITGSGKSFSASSFIKSITTKPRESGEGNPVKALTVEDPPEYPIPFSHAIPVTRTKDRPKSFAQCLREALHCDPDVLFIGEIRDKEVGDTVIDSVLSGIMVSSTIFASSPYNAFRQLDAYSTNDMGDDPLFLNGIVYQALLPKTCTSCSKLVSEKAVPETHAEVFERLKLSGVESIRIRNKKGCFDCIEGVESRTVVAEIVPVTPEIYKALRSGNMNLAKSIHLQNGGKTIQDHALEKVLAGEVDPLDAEEKIGPFC